MGRGPSVVGVMNQGAIFRESEGDAWFRRNRKALETVVERDIPLRLLADGVPALGPDSTVLEVGCSNGWRLNELQRRYDCDAYGIDVSTEAIQDGLRRFPGLNLAVASATGAASRTPRADLVIVFFVCHWIARDELLPSLAAIDRAVGEGGYLLLGDFLPDAYTEVPYHHRPGLFTYKSDYATPFIMAGYRVVRETVFNHDTGQEFDRMSEVEVMGDVRAHCTLLEKRRT